MAEDENRQEKDENLAPEKRLEKALSARWDPAKLSQFMRASEGSRAQRLDASQRGRFEKRLGIDLGDVRIYTGTLAEEITKAHGAEALTVGDTGIILMRQSTKFAQGSAAYTALLAHELTHVAQARPDAMSRKSTTASQAEESESEKEAEVHEREVMAEELGMPEAKPGEAEKGEAQQGKKDKLLAMVLELMDNEDWVQELRTGSRAHPLF